MIAYLIEENRVLKQQLESGGRRLRFTDDQRRRLAAKGKPLGRKVLSQIATIVTPDTMLVWHRRLVASKWTFPRKGVGRPGVMTEIRGLTVQMAEENPSWGYARIQGQLKHLNHRVARSTIAEYSAHYHEDRSHQGIGNVLVSGAEPQSEGIVETRERIGGLLKYYYRQAA